MALAALSAGCATDGREPAARPAASPVAALSFPSPSQAPAPPATVEPPLAPDEVRVEEGPFTDRVRFTGLALTDRCSVRGRLIITSDTSQVLALEVRAAFYDAKGRLLSTAAFRAGGGHVHGGHEAAEGEEGIGFTVTAPKGRDKVSGVVVSVPVLVNE
ncbi:hypothetical protein [Streptomyces mesophilus]|uniref:hypothetical protein n=1 Tax=Streptomyces mesophilus TaxID=1775132 RepID=UPI0033169D2B